MSARVNAVFRAFYVFYGYRHACYVCRHVSCELASSFPELNDVSNAYIVGELREAITHLHALHEQLIYSEYSDAR